MVMHFFARVLAISTAVLVSSWATAQTLQPVTDPAAHEIYSMILNLAWPSRSTNNPLLLQQETDILAILPFIRPVCRSRMEGG